MLQHSLILNSVQASPPSKLQYNKPKVKSLLPFGDESSEVDDSDKGIYTHNAK